MAHIRKLDEQTINKIAAGEVVGRPSSVVKELLENALDSGASKIVVEIENGGKTLIKISDNGCGMDKEDASLCLVRHATSKIESIQDLLFLDTLGFRGEAVASISAVSQFTLQTKIEESEEGVEIVVVNGEEHVTSLPMDQGTTVIVKDLFFNVPARLKFLKTDRTEFLHILKFIHSISFVNKHVAFRLFNNGKEVFSVSGKSDDEEILSTVYSHDVYTDMKKIDFKVEGCQISGYISVPASSRVDREKQVFLVNHRLVQSALLSRAVRDSLSYVFPPNRFPYMVLHIEIDPSEVDVNVHPSKLEVKFGSSNTVFQLVRRAIKSAFDAPSTKVVESDGVMATDNPSSDSDLSQFDNKVVFQDHKVVKRSPVKAAFVTERLLHADPVKEPTLAEMKTWVNIENKTHDQDQESLKTSNSREIMQILQTYLVFDHEYSLYVVDQHVAHERILFEKLRATEKKIICQELLLPETIFLDAQEMIHMEKMKPLLEIVGFSLESFGKDSYILRAVPQFLEHKNCKDLIKDVLSENENLDLNKMQEKLYTTVACKAAIKAGAYLTVPEREQLIEDWLVSPNRESCPHGRPIVKIFDKDSLDQFFWRK